MTKVNISSFLAYPVFRLGDSPFTRKLHTIHSHIIGFVKFGSILFPTLALGYILIGFYLPAKISFATHTENCAFVPSFLPKLTSASPTEQYRVFQPTKLSINGYPILSTQLCVEPTSVPSNSSDGLSVRQLGLPFSKSLTVSNSSSLYASPVIKGDSVSTKTNLIFALSKPDFFFGYNLQVADKSVDCLVQASTVSCPTSELGLKQGEPYTFVLKQSLGKTSQQLYTNKLTTITSVEMQTSSIAADQVVFDSPIDIKIVFSKPIVRISDVKLDAGGQTEPITHTIIDKTVTISWDKPLERQKSYKLTIGNVAAEDGGFLELPLSLPFQTSGGPKVSSSNLPAYKSNSSVDFTLSFDHSPQPDQDFGTAITITSSGKQLPATYTASGNNIRVRTKSALPSCTEFTVSIKDILKSSFGISGGNAYSATSRTQCSSVFSIGKSVELRDITAYKIGSGPEQVLFIGAIHGNEKSAFYLLNSWLDYLESSPGSIPSSKTITIIPNANPDGFAKNSRYNANNVDLNRNFASANWKTDVKVPGGGILAGGGGSAPLSEPESKAIIDHIQLISPSLVMSYHSQGSIVIGNGSGNSLGLAAMYSSAVGYKNVAPESSADAFEHDTTGALEDWLHESPDIPVVLLELSSHTTSTIFPFHKAAMLNVIK